MKIPETAFRLYENKLDPRVPVDQQGYTHMIVPVDQNKDHYDVGDEIWVLDLTDPDAEWYWTTVTEDGHVADA